jgi:hypothetical protein
MSGFGRAPRLLERGGVRRVDGDEARPDTGGLERRDASRSPFLRAAHDDDGRAGLAEAVAQGTAEDAGPADDRGDGTAQVEEIHARSSR